MKDFTKCIELKSDNTECYIQRGSSFQELGRFDEAIADLTRAIDLDPRSLLGWLLRGHTYNKLYRYERAAADYTQVLTLAGAQWKIANASSVYEARSQAYARLHKFDDAFADCNRAKRLDPASSPAWRSHGRVRVDAARTGIYVEANFAKAIEDFDKAVNLEPGGRQSYGDKALAYVRFGNWAKAVVDSEKCISLSPDYHAGHVAKALANLFEKGEGVFRDD